MMHFDAPSKQLILFAENIYISKLKSQHVCVFICLLPLFETEKAESCERSEQLE